MIKRSIFTLALILLLNLPIFAAPAWVKDVKIQAVGAANQDHLTVSLSGTSVASGDHLIVVAFRQKTGDTISACSDTQGNTYGLDFTGADLGSGNDDRYAVCSAHMTTALTTADSVTMTWTGGAANTYFGAALVEYSGIASTSWLDKTASATAPANTATISSTATTTLTGTNDLVFGVLSVNDNTKTIVQGAGFNTIRTGFADVNAGISFAPEDQTVSSNAAVTATGSWTTSSTQGSGAAVVTYIAAGGGATIAVTSAYNSGYKTASSSYTIPAVNCSGSNRFVLVGAGMLSVAGASVSSVSMTDLTFIKVGVVTSATGTIRAELWQGIAPAAAGRDITVTYSTSLISGAGAVCFSGVQQVSPTESENDNTATNVGATDATVAIATIQDNDFIFAVVATDDTSVTTGQTSQFNITGAGGSVVGETFGPQTPPGSKTMNFTSIGSAATWAIDGIGVRLSTDAAIKTGSSMLLTGVQ